MWEGGGEKKGRGGFAVHSHVEAQSGNNLSQPALASYGLWYPALSLTAQDYSLSLSIALAAPLSLCLCSRTRRLPLSSALDFLVHFYQHVPSLSAMIVYNETPGQNAGWQADGCVRQLLHSWPGWWERGKYRGKERKRERKRERERERESKRQREGTAELEIERENREWGHLSLLLIGYQAAHSLHPIW